MRDRPDDAIPWHPHVSTSIDWEVELGGDHRARGARHRRGGRALDYVFGYTVANDVTARDLQQRHAQWYKGKGLDGFCPLGPSSSPRTRSPTRSGSTSACASTASRSSVRTRASISSAVARLIAEWSAGMTLLPGDILLTGTPSGVGIGRTPPEFLRPGDVVEAEVGGIGVLRKRRRRGE